MAFIEECLGDSWPKPLYPHGAGREWSTTMRDPWKADQAFEVVPAEHLRAIAEVLDRGIPDDRKLATVVRLVNQTLCAPLSRGPIRRMERLMADALLELSDQVERTFDDAQASFLNGFPEDARAKASEAIRLIDRIIDRERRTRGGYDES